MARRVALLRGINIGPHKRIAMADLRATVESLGHTEVSTYVASGNVVFSGSGSTAELATGLRSAIADRHGVDCAVAVLSPAQVDRAAGRNPYPDEPSPKLVHVGFVTGDAAAVRGLVERLAEVGGDTCQMVGDVLYLHTPGGFGISPLVAQFSKDKASREVTMRNWNTITKLQEMLAD